eukprot:4435283-Amphidinium_carterae.1
MKTEFHKVGRRRNICHSTQQKYARKCSSGRRITWHLAQGSMSPSYVVRKPCPSCRQRMCVQV